jgi:hypothetical protein
LEKRWSSSSSTLISRFVIIFYYLLLGCCDTISEIDGHGRYIFLALVLLLLCISLSRLYLRIYIIDRITICPACSITHGDWLPHHRYRLYSVAACIYASSLKNKRENLLYVDVMTQRTTLCVYLYTFPCHPFSNKLTISVGLYWPYSNTGGRQRKPHIQAAALLLSMI